jgi:hypothetical protein
LLTRLTVSSAEVVFIAELKDMGYLIMLVDLGMLLVTGRFKLSLWGAAYSDCPFLASEPWELW